MLTLEDRKFSEAMASDFTVVASFFNNPKETMEQWKVGEELKSAILNKDAAALIDLGWSEDDMQVYLSGAHTSKLNWCVV